MKRSAVRARPPSGGHGPQSLFLVLLQMVHVEITGRFKPVLVHLDGQCPDQPVSANKRRSPNLLVTAAVDPSRD